MRRMGRKRIHGKGLPTRVYLRRGAYYFVSAQGKWHRLATEGDLAGMHRELSDLLERRCEPTLAQVMDRYEREVLPGKAVKTQRDQSKQLDVLRRVFGSGKPSDVRPTHVAAFLDTYPAKTQADRIIALLSHVYKQAIRWGHCDTNPCSGVERNNAGKRDVYVTHEQFWSAWRDAGEMMQLAMELAYVTGQRQGDILGLKWSDCRDDGVYFTQGKTGRRLRVEWSEWLRDVLARCKATQSDALGFYVLADRRGQRITSSGFQTAWQRFMHDRPDRFQFKDIRKKSANDAASGEHLGHTTDRTLQQWYMLKPKGVTGVTGRE